MHCQGNYFSEVRHSDLDVEVEIGATDDTYLQLLAHHLPLVLGECQPQLIFYQAGVDALGSDRLGKLSLSQDGLQRRDQLVYDACKRANIPLVVTMGGGYPTDLNQESVSYREVIRAHVNVYKGMLSLVGEE
jgi:acetoin utilization deacetylase AcuC-like enzyme